MKFRNGIGAIALAMAVGMLGVGAVRAAAALPPGVAGDGVTDDTVAIQSALNAAGKTGGEVFLPAGQYLVKGNLTVPTGVSLTGSWEAPHHGAWDKGTTLLLTAGRGQETGQAAITLQQSSAIRGFTLLWPEEKGDNIVAYPWAIHGTGMHNTVENVTLVNAYQGILIGEPGSELHLIRSVYGCVLRRGLFIDSTSDVGRVEDIHFNTHYWMRSGYGPILSPDPGNNVTAYTMSHLEAFIFGRSDWEYVQNTFVWGAKIGYRFIKTPDGECNGEFTNIGADDCNVGLLVDNIQSAGIQITNGEFTAFSGAPNAGIVISPGATGAAQFVNCNFWTTPGGAVQVHGNVQVVLNACHFSDAVDPAVIVADKGQLSVTSCSFAGGGTAISLLPGTRAGVITGNLQAGGLVVDNQIGASAQIGLNEAPYVYPAAQLSHYRIKIGGDDGDFLGTGWNGGEDADDVPAALKPAVTTARWSSGNSTLHLPVKAGAAYTLTVWVLTRDKTPQYTFSVAGANKAVTSPGKVEVLTLNIPASATAGKNTVTLHIDGNPWSPSQIFAGSGDNRKLGARVFAVEMTAVGSADKASDLD